MPRHHELTSKQIRGWVDEQSFERGYRYFTEGAVSDGRLEGDTLKALCEGSSGGPYRVSVTLGERGIQSADCTCPVGGGGRCKHVAAMLLAWSDSPRRFPKVERADEALARLSKEQLVALVHRMVKEYPDLEELVRNPLPVPGQAGARVDPGVYRKQARGVFRRAGDEWGVERQIADGLRAVLDYAYAFDGAGETGNALAVFTGVLTEAMANREDYEDEAGDLDGMIGEAADRAAALLPKLADAGDRIALLQLLFDVYRYDTERGGVDIAGEKLYDALTEDSTPDERREIAEWVGKEARRSSGWAKEGYGGLLLELQAEGMDDEAYLRVCRETGRTEDLVDRLLERGRFDEAEEALRKAASSYDLTRLADLFVQHGKADAAETVVRARAEAKPSPKDYAAGHHRQALLEWLKRRAAARKDTPEALSIALELFKASPSLEGYKEVRELGRKVRQWDELRPALLDHLRKGDGARRDLLVRVHLAEKEVAEAVAALEALKGRDDPWGWGHNTQLEVARAAEGVRPKVSLEIYRQRAESLIRGASREYYRDACTFLKKVKALYRDVGESQEWERYVGALREKHQRLRALREEMHKARL